MRALACWGLGAPLLLVACLRPPEQAAQDGGAVVDVVDGGAPDGQSNCTTIIEDDFEDLVGGPWIPVSGSNGDIRQLGSELILTADPGADSYAYAEVYNEVAHTLANSVLTAELRAETGADSQAWLLFIDDETESLGFVIEPDRLSAERTQTGEQEDLCVGCPYYDGTSQLWLRIVSDSENSTLSWSDDGSSFSNIAVVPVPDYEPHLYIGTEAPMGSTSVVTVDTVAWLECPP